MVQVRGTVHDVSDNPDRVEKIIVRAVEPRMHGTTYITEEPTQFPVVDGVLDFNVLPGPCVVAFLRPHGATTYEKLLVPDVAEATFRECLDAAALAEEGTKSALEKVVRQIQEELAKAAPLVDEMRSLRTDVSNDRAAVDGFTKAAKASASAAASSETNAKTSETNANTHRTAAATQASAASESASQAATARDAAKQSQTAAKTSETNAASSASASASSASSSKTQADKSAASATQAASARDAAKTSETNAAGSAAAAKTSETNSKQHETNAGDYAAVATTAATEAVDAMERATEVVGGDFATREYVDNAVTRTPRVLLHYGTDFPVLSDFPEARENDVIERVSDESRWRVDKNNSLVRTVQNFTDLNINNRIVNRNGETAGNARISRHGRIVTLTLDFPVPEGGPAPGRAILHLPTSLWKGANIYWPPGYSGDTVPIYVSSGGLTYGANGTTRQWVRRSATWITSAAGAAVTEAELLSPPPES